MPEARAATPTLAVDLRALVPTPTGIGVYTRSLLKALAARQRLRCLGVAHAAPRGAADLAAAGIAVEQQRAPLGVVWQQLVLPRRLAKGDVDLFWSPLLTLPWRCPVPAVATVHDLTAMLMPENHSLKVRLSILPFLARSIDTARRIVTLSHAVARDLAFHFPESAGKVRVVPPGIDPEFRPAAREAIEATRRELGAPLGYVLYAGTLEPRKNLATLLDAWQLVATQGEAPPLLLAGPYGWGSRDLMRRIDGLAPRVRALGHVDRALLVRLFQAATVFVYPSFSEGFGLPPAEALACGVPTVVSNVSSLPEVVGDAGVQVDPEDAGALAAALGGLLADPARREELGRRAVARAARFNWERAAEEMEAVFLEALTLPGSSGA